MPYKDGVVPNVQVVCDSVMNVEIFCHSKTFKHSSVILSAQYIGEEISREREDKDEQKVVANIHYGWWRVVVEVREVGVGFKKCNKLISILKGWRFNCIRFLFKFGFELTFLPPPCTDQQ